MYKRDMRGKWDFIDMINGGLLALLTRFSFRVFNEGGIPLFRFHFYSTNNKQGSNINTMHKNMVEGWNLMYMLLMCEAIPFKWSILQMKLQIQTPIWIHFNQVTNAIVWEMQLILKCVWYASDVQMKCGMLLIFKLQKHLNLIWLNSN